jgi:hypothetical protein
MDDGHGAMRAWVGKVVSVACTNGRTVEGTLLNVNRRSLWVVDGDHDVLIPWQEVDQVT